MIAERYQKNQVFSQVLVIHSQQFVSELLPSVLKQLIKVTLSLPGIDEKSLLQAVDAAVGLCKDGQHGIPVPDYIDENVSTKIIKISPKLCRDSQ